MDSLGPARPLRGPRERLGQDLICGLRLIGAIDQIKALVSRQTVPPIGCHTAGYEFDIGKG